MKVLSARANLNDRRDVATLIERLGLVNREEVIEIVKHYYPHKEMKPAAHMLLKEIFAR
jgi:hypothetical protein